MKAQEFIKKWSITTDGNNPVLGLMNSDGKVYPFQKTVFDSQTSPSGVSGQLFHHYIDPETIRILQKPLAVVESMGGKEVTIPNWSTDTWFGNFTEDIGGSSEYSDFDDSITSNTNREYINRNAYRHQSVCAFGEFEIAKASAENYDIISEKRSSATRALNVTNNRIAAFGVAGRNIFGVLNEPNLNATTAVTKAWDTATFEEIKKDIFSMINEIVKNTANLVSINDEFEMTVAGTTYVSLAQSENQYGITLLERLNKAFPRLKIMTLAEFDTTTGTIAELRCVSHTSSVWSFGFGQKLKMHRIDARTSSQIQKMSSQTFGARLNHALMVARRSGV